MEKQVIVNLALSQSSPRLTIILNVLSSPNITGSKLHIDSSTPTTILPSRLDLCMEIIFILHYL